MGLRGCYRSSFSNYLIFQSESFLLEGGLCCLVILTLISEFLATDPEARVRFPALPEKKVVGLEQGPLSLVSTTEELLDRKVAATV
jgi:hypothetical protein